MVYYHGGGLLDGATGTDFGVLASHGEGVVVVDVNYRLAAAGECSFYNPPFVQCV